MITILYVLYYHIAYSIHMCMKLYWTIMYNMKLDFLCSEEIIWTQTNENIIIQEKELSWISQKEPLEIPEKDQ